MTARPTIAITSGEPAGIGPELMAAIDPTAFDARLVIIGDQQLIETRAELIEQSIQLQPYRPGHTPDPAALEILHVDLVKPSLPGQLDSDNASYVLALLDRAANGCLDGEFDAMVTAPIQKDIINQAGVSFSGHTEYLAGLCGMQKPVMLLHTDNLRVALATTHLPLSEVAEAISAEPLEQIIRILAEDLHKRFGIGHPHIKVCGLNPHAGENGYLGREEIDIINPLIERMQQQGIHVSGSYPADTVFTHESLADADAVLAMYHDQGLPVLKHVGFNHAVNSTLGLSIIRTSVDHGTALELAGSGQAHADSLLAAIHSAIDQAANNTASSSNTRT